jgi:hypothetical protein
MSLASIPLAFSFKSNVFEGPLELLIELVEKRKLLINDISGEVAPTYGPVYSTSSDIAFD